MKDMGRVEFVLNVKFQRDRSKRLSLSQESSIKKVLERFNTNISKPLSTPITKSKFPKLCPITLEEKQKMTKI